ncbi:hypothetical protein CF319_g3854 [Tilletia indica]|uniref:Thioredoxin n=1 Tax=Tilletia indica TaxID=43049 RepID=A0A177TPF9_9BASI|nr:hypothetical protein CF327_g5580 [Tilletia walkeri]KAE8223052.1 hypothetical protein CF319_g3854 [Tilletia indica]KAE8232199.1 hypothetical protein CF326_g2773 [Tilletia indica]KAE8250984.1 hypothetical protein A4X13_0g4208 [Tilletia indica]
MSVTPLKSLSEFNAAIKDNKAVVIDFWAEWCGPCKMISPIFEKLADQHGEKVKFFKVDVDAAPDIGQELGIRAMPTFQLYVDGQKSGEVVGAIPPQLNGLISQAVAAV